MRNADSPHPSAPTESTSASEQDSPTWFVCTVKFEKHCHIISKWKKEVVVQWKRASSRVDAGTSGLLSVSDSDPMSGNRAIKDVTS